MPHPRTKPKQHIHSKSQCNLIKRAKHSRKSLIAASYPGLVISNAKVNRSNLHVQHTFLHIVVRVDDSLKTKISWMHFGRFSFTQNLRNFGNCGNWYSIFPEKFPDFRKRFRNANHSTSQTFGSKFECGKKLFPMIIFENLGVYCEMLFHSVLHGSCRKFKPDVLTEWNGAHAKATKFVTNCAPFARA